ncbi:MAG TPA: hypothetical protein V6D17_05230 [Candidatus Obscuribacterales bacterium]
MQATSQAGFNTFAANNNGGRKPIRVDTHESARSLVAETINRQLARRTYQNQQALVVKAQAQADARRAQNKPQRDKGLLACVQSFSSCLLELVGLKKS